MICTCCPSETKVKNASRRCNRSLCIQRLSRTLWSSRRWAGFAAAGKTQQYQSQFKTGIVSSKWFLIFRCCSNGKRYSQQASPASRRHILRVKCYLVSNSALAVIHTGDIVVQTLLMFRNFLSLFCLSKIFVCSRVHHMQH